LKDKRGKLPEKPEGNKAAELRQRGIDRDRHEAEGGDRDGDRQRQRQEKEVFDQEREMAH